MVTAFNDGFVDVSHYDLFWQASSGNNGELLQADMCKLLRQIRDHGSMFGLSGEPLFHAGHDQRPSIVIRMAALSYSSSPDTADDWQCEWISEPMTMRDRIDDIRSAAGLPDFDWRHSPKYSDLDISMGTFPIQPKILMEMHQALGRFSIEAGPVYSVIRQIKWRRPQVGTHDGWLERSIYYRNYTDAAYMARTCLRYGNRRKLYDRPGHQLPITWIEVKDYISENPVDHEFTPSEPHVISGLGNMYSGAVPVYRNFADEYLRYVCRASSSDTSAYTIRDWTAQDSVVHYVYNFGGVSHAELQCGTDAFLSDTYDADATYSSDLETYGDTAGFEQYMQNYQRWSAVATENWNQNRADYSLRYYNSPVMPDRIPRLAPDAWFEPYVA